MSEGSRVIQRIGMVMGGVVLFFFVLGLFQNAPRDDRKESIQLQKEFQINQEINQLEQDRTSLNKQIDDIRCPGLFDAPLGFKSCAKEQELKANLKDELAEVEREEKQLNQPQVPKAQPYNIVGDPNACDATAAYNNRCGK